MGVSCQWGEPMTNIQPYESLSSASRSSSQRQLLSVRDSPTSRESDDDEFVVQVETSYYNRVRDAVKWTLEDPNASTVGQGVQIFVITMILFSTTCVIMETVPDLSVFAQIFNHIEQVCTLLFTAEFLLRMWISEEMLAFIVTWHSAIDLAAIAPWYVENVLYACLRVHRSKVDEDVADSFKTLRIVRILQFIRLLRVLRLAKAAKHSDMISTVLESIRASLSGFGALVAFICMGTVFSATAVYFLECEEPETAFSSIPAAIWWAMPTITGVGYGDMVPETVAGKAAGSVTMVGGILITSLSVAIMTKSFVESFERTMQLKKVAKRRTKTADNRQSIKNVSSIDLQKFRERTVSEDCNEFILPDEDPLISLTKLEHALGTVLTSLDFNCVKHAEDSGNDPHHLLRSSWDLLRGQNELWFKHVRQLAEQAATLETCQSLRTPDMTTNIFGTVTPPVLEVSSDGNGTGRESSGLPYSRSPMSRIASGGSGTNSMKTVKFAPQQS